MRRKPAACSKAFGPSRGDLLQIRSRPKGAVAVPIADDIPCKLRSQSRYIGKELRTGRVHFNADCVDTAHDRIVQAFLQFVLIDVVLVLAYPDRLRIDLDQFREGIHQTPSYGYGTADGHVMVGKFLAGHGGSRIDGCPAFITHDNLNAFRKIETPDERFRFPAGSAVSYGNGFDVEAGGQRLDAPRPPWPKTALRNAGRSSRCGGAFPADRGRPPCTPSGNPDRRPGPSSIPGERPSGDGAGCRRRFGSRPHRPAIWTIASPPFRGREQEAFCSRRAPRPGPPGRRPNPPLRKSEFEDRYGVTLGRSDVNAEKPFLLPAARSENPVRRRFPRGFFPVVIVAVQDALALSFRKPPRTA